MVNAPSFTPLTETLAYSRPSLTCPLPTELEAYIAAPGGGLTKADLFELGLSGGPDSAEKRRALLARLELPEHLSASAMLETLNLLYGREELLTLLQDGGPEASK